MISRKLLEELSYEVGVEAGAIYAIVSTESNGAFEWGDGKIPILFERHICYRQLKKAKGYWYARQMANNYPDICNPKWGGYGRSSEQYGRLANAIMLFGNDVAHMSASFGAFQIMGFNHKMAGYESAKAMSDAFHEDPVNEQVKGFMNFVKGYHSGKLLRALKRKDWSEVARRYNGSDYKRNAYDTKMKIANHAYNKGSVALA